MINKKWVFVASGESGIGAGIVKRLASEGYKIIFTYRSREDRALAVSHDIKAKGGECDYYYCDIRDNEKVKALCLNLVSTHGAPYGIVNNSGKKNDKLLLNTEIDEWHDVINTNLNGTFYVIRALLPSMIATGDGCVIVISSVSALRGNVGQTAYSASKAAQCGLIRSLAREVGLFNVRVNSVVPGLIETDMLASLEPKQRKLLASQTALRKTGCTDDIAQTVSFLLGDGGKYISGQNIVVDGGLSI